MRYNEKNNYLQQQKEDMFQIDIGKLNANLFLSKPISTMLI